jgi:hypothetical protein
MGRAMLGLSFVLLLILSSPIRAADAAAPPHHAGAATAPHGAAAATPHHRPALPKPSPLPGTTIILILGLFLAAAVVGPTVRYHTPEEVPDAPSHDEHGHGAHDAHGHGH